MSTKRPALLPEDGAIFIGEVEEIEPGLFQATCHAQLDHRSNVEVEDPEYFIAPSFEEGKAWIAAKAAVRGFKVWQSASKRQ